MKTTHATRTFGSRREAPLWLFAAIVVAALMLIKLVIGLGAAVGVPAIFGYIALIGVGAFFWGADSREPGRNFYSHS